MHCDRAATASSSLEDKSLSEGVSFEEWGFSRAESEIGWESLLVEACGAAEAKDCAKKFAERDIAATSRLLIPLPEL